MLLAAAPVSEERVADTRVGVFGGIVEAESPTTTKLKSDFNDQDDLFEGLSSQHSGSHVENRQSE